MKDDLRFNDIRSDWYHANTLLPRLFVRSLLERRPFRLIEFPALWIPVATHYGIEIQNSRAPLSYVPLFSELSIDQVVRMAARAIATGSSRALIEAVAALDPVIADFIYIVDHRLAAAGYGDPGQNGLNLLNTWHSFGRPEIITLQQRMAQHVLKGKVFLMMPCARHRPYSESRTHRRLFRQLSERGVSYSEAEKVVVTALGVVPESYWREPLVMSYDAGAVDLWRVFQLLRKFFSTNPPQRVIDCLSFKPYADMLGLLHDLGQIPDLLRPVKIRWRSFQVKLA